MIEEAFSHYRILRKLGAGGMGEVYLAEDTTLGRRVALKVLPAVHTQDQERLRRFKQEAKSASALNHPNILTIHEVGEADGRHFIATEWIDGETLRALLERSRSMETGEALRMAAQVASALVAAHEAGIVHRDIKPENIMLRRDGYVKVLDFGLAKLTQADGPPLHPNTATRSIPVQTEAGLVVGTAQYMAPEQATGRKVDARSDIFSFGAVLYEMVSGARAFEGASAMEILAAVINQEPKPLPRKVPPELANVILRCLRKDPSRRYQTMAETKIALEDLSGQPFGVPRGRLADAIPHWGWLAGAVALVMVALVGRFTWQAFRAPQNAEPLLAVALTTLPGIEASPSLSPDGNYVVFAWSGPKQDNQDIYVQMIGSGSPLALTKDPLHDYNPVWSPDGRLIAFFRSPPPAPTGIRSRELRLIPPLGGSERKLADIRGQDVFPIGAYLAWLPDSRGLVVTDSPGDGQPDALFVVSLETGEKRRLTNPQPPALADTSPAVSPDGRSLVFLRRTTWGAGELQVLALDKNLSASEPTRLTAVELRADYPAWMPDGDEIVFSAKGALWRLTVQGGDSPTRIAYVGEDGLTPVVSRPERDRPTRLVYTRSFRDQNFWRIETAAPGAPAPDPPVATAFSTKPEYHAQFSPDARRIVFTSLRTGDAEIWISDPDGTNAIQLTSTGAQDSNCPDWSPDGQLIAYSSNADGEFDVYVVPAAGGKPRRLTSHPSIDLCPKFSRDGMSIFFSSMRSGDYRVWKMPATGGEAVQITPNQGGRAFESRDGSIYYVDIAVLSSLWRLPRPGAEPIKMVDGVVWFNFYPIDHGAYYIDRLESDTRLQYLDFATGKSAIVARNLGDVTAGLTASRDGKTILFSRLDSSTDDLMLVENFR